MNRKSRAAILVCIWLVIICLLPGCKNESFIARMVPKEDDDVARYYIDLLRKGDLEPIERDFDAKVKPPDLHGALLTVLDAFPSNDPQSVKIVGCNRFVTHMLTGPLRGQNLFKTEITYEYQYPDTSLLISFMTQKKGDTFTIIGLHLTDRATLENLNGFTMGDKSLLQCTALAFVFVIPLFTLYCLVKCITDKRLKRKWLWVPFIIFGFGKLSMNWTTGQWDLNPFEIVFMGAKLTRFLNGPWMIGISIPLGAIIYMLRREGVIKLLTPGPIGEVPVDPKNPKPADFDY